MARRALADFIGTFEISRAISDELAGVQARFEGHAVISAADDGALYRETGTLISNGQRFEATRVYRWYATGARIFVSFEDGAPFHDFDPVAGGGVAQHHCGSDIYRGGYDFADWPNWSVSWDVSGPRKAYRSVTRYTAY